MKKRHSYKHKIISIVNTKCIYQKIQKQDFCNGEGLYTLLGNRFLSYNNNNNNSLLAQLTPNIGSKATYKQKMDQTHSQSNNNYPYTNKQVSSFKFISSSGIQVCNKSTMYQ